MHICAVRNYRSGISDLKRGTALIQRQKNCIGLQDESSYYLFMNAPLPFA